MKQGYDELLNVIFEQAETIKGQAEQIRRLSALIALLENDKTESEAEEN